MIDIRIGPGQAPKVGICAEFAGHVLVDERLQVDTNVAAGADDDVGANAALDRDVTSRERNDAVVWIVIPRNAHLRVGTGEKLMNMR